MSKDPRVDGPSTVLPQKPATPTTKKTIKTTFESQEAAEKFLKEREAAAQNARGGAKIALKLTPALAQPAVPKTAPQTETAKAQTAELKGANTAEKAQQVQLRTQLQTTTGATNLKSIPLPAALISKPDKAILKEALQKMGAASQLATFAETPGLRQQITGQLALLNVDPTVTRWTIIGMLMDAHALNREINSKAADASFAAQAKMGQLDRAMSVLDRQMNNVLAGAKAELKSLEAFKDGFKGITEGIGQITGAVKSLTEAAADRRVENAEHREAALTRADEAQHTFNEAMAGGSEEEINMAYDELLAARDAAGVSPALTPRGATGMQRDQQRALAGREGTVGTPPQSLTNALAAAHTETTVAREAQAAVHASTAGGEGRPVARANRGLVDAARTRAGHSETGARATMAENTAASYRARLDEMRGRTPRDEEAIQSLERAERRMTLRAQALRSQADAETSALTSATNRASAVLSEESSLSTDGRIGGAEMDRDAVTVHDATARYEAVIRNPRSSPADRAAALREFDAAIAPIEARLEARRAAAGGRSEAVVGTVGDPNHVPPIAPSGYMAVWDRSRIADRDYDANAAALRDNDAALASARSELATVDNEIGDGPGNAELTRRRTELQGTVARLTQEHARLEARGTALAQSRDAARYALAAARNVGPGEGDARFPTAAESTAMSTDLAALHRSAVALADADGALAADRATDGAERHDIAGDGTGGPATESMFAPAPPVTLPGPRPDSPPRTIPVPPSGDELITTWTETRDEERRLALRDAGLGAEADAPGTKDARKAEIEAERALINARRAELQAYPRLLQEREEVLAGNPVNQARLTALNNVLGTPEATREYRALTAEYNAVNPQPTAEVRARIETRMAELRTATPPVLGARELAMEDRRLELEGLRGSTTDARRTEITMARNAIHTRQADIATALPPLVGPYRADGTARPPPRFASPEEMRSVMESESGRLLRERATLMAQPEPRSSETTRRLGAIDTQLTRLRNRATTIDGRTAPALEATRRNAAADFVRARAALNTHVLDAMRPPGASNPADRSVSFGIPPPTSPTTVHGDVAEGELYNAAFTEAYADRARFGPADPAGPLAPPPGIFISRRATLAQQHLDELSRAVPAASGPALTAARDELTAANAEAATISGADAFARDYGTWTRDAGPPATFRMTAPPNSPPSGVLPQDVTMDMVNNPDSAPTPELRTRAREYRTEVANARLRVLQEQAEPGMAAITASTDRHVPADRATALRAATAELSAARRGLGGAAPPPEGAQAIPTPTDGTALSAADLATNRYIAARQALADANTAADAAPGVTPRVGAPRPPDATEAIAAAERLRTADANLARARARVADFDATHPNGRHDAALERDVYDAERERDAAQTALDRTRPPAPGPGFFTKIGQFLSSPIMNSILQWGATIADPAGKAAMQIADSLWNIGRGVGGDVHAAMEIYDGVFNQMHAELKMLEQRSDNDWQEKLNAMRALVDAHVKAGGKAQ